VGSRGRRGLLNCIAFDDAPFERARRRLVPLVGVVFASLRLDGVLIGRIRQDGINSTGQIIRMVGESKFNEHINLIMLDGIAFGGFNVVDAFRLQRQLARPVLVVTRRRPDMEAIKRALEPLPSGARKWRLIQQLGPMEPCGSCWVQRVGLSREEAKEVIDFFSIYGNLPEPIRIAHLIAGAVGSGISKGRA
jgi:endonuclease V-like protein UPF0215 family